METFKNTKTRTKTRCAFFAFLYREQRENQKRVTKTSAAQKNLPPEGKPQRFKVLEEKQMVIEKHMALLSISFIYNGIVRKLNI
jgi:hypothetical protein